MITPLFHDGEAIGFAASRAHHADVGAKEPGSMPADSRTLEDEGVVIPPTRLDAETLRELAGRMRNPRQREADLRAQLAAGRAGAERVDALIERFGLDSVRAGLEETLDYAERRTRARIAELDDGVREAADVLEAANDEDIELRLRADGGGRRDHARLQRLGRAARGQPQLPARGHALGLLLRRCACSPTPTCRPARAPTGR